MDLTPYVDDLQQRLALAAEGGGDEARQIAERLAAPLEAATRLILLEALSNAASELTRDLAPGSVEIRLRGLDPEFVVTQPPTPEYADVATHVSEPATASAALDFDETSTSRTTLRLPDQLKSRVDEAASADGLSVNAWLVRAIAAALEPKQRKTAQKEARGEQFTGWAS